MPLVEAELHQDLNTQSHFRRVLVLGAESQQADLVESLRQGGGVVISCPDRAHLVAEAHRGAGCIVIPSNHVRGDADLQDSPAFTDIPLLVGLIDSSDEVPAGLQSWPAGRLTLVDATRPALLRSAVESALRVRELLVQRSGGLDQSGTLDRLTTSQQLQVLLDMAPAIIFTCDVDGRCTYINERFTELTGVSHDDALGVGWQDVVHREDVSKIETALREARVEERLFDVRFRLRSRVGTYRWFMARSRPVYDAQGSLSGWMGSSVDIDELVTAQQELARRTQELARSNAELEQFASIVSHDLRSPLLSMAGCVELLSEQYTGQLDAEADELIGFVTAGVQRMNEMIKSLLHYSRTGSGAMNVSDVALDPVVDEVVRALAGLVQSSGGSVTRDSLPTVRGDATRLSQLLQNLIENALKYRGEQSPRVHISSQDSGTDWVICVRDNGIGVPAEHRERIFKVFQRLHSDQSQYKGTGIGLAICKKIVERHGGRIWAEDGEQGGATFCFSMPK